MKLLNASYALQNFIASSGMVRRSFEAAHVFHSGQVRKYTNDPYITHPIAVADTVIQHFGYHRQMVCAALLHDVVEDTSATFTDVRSLTDKETEGYVRWLTDNDRPEDGNRAVRKLMCLRRLQAAPLEARAVKIADLIDNTSTIVKYDKAFAKTYLSEKKDLLNAFFEPGSQGYLTPYNKLWQHAFDVLKTQQSRRRALIHG
jgi:(p)ppGpp synthase/HD superfamily hydrolase